VDKEMMELNTDQINYFRVCVNTVDLHMLLSINRLIWGESETSLRNTLSL